MGMMLQCSKKDREVTVAHLQQFKCSTLLQLLEHRFQMPEAPPSNLHVFLKVLAMEDFSSISKVLLEGEQILRNLLLS